LYTCTCSTRVATEVGPSTEAPSKVFYTFESTFESTVRVRVPSKVFYLEGSYYLRRYTILLFPYNIVVHVYV